MQLQYPGTKPEEYASLDEDFAAFMECRETAEDKVAGEPNSDGDSDGWQI